MLPVALIEQRRRLGLDRRDEVWDGELHMVPTPGSIHQRFSKRLLFALDPIATRRGLEVFFEFNVRDPSKGWDDYRVPDLVVFDPTQPHAAAVDGPAEIVVEILSPGDESRKKFGFYARRGVREVWIADPDNRRIEVFALQGDRYEAVAAMIDGIVRTTLGFEIAHDPLRIRDGSDVYII